MRTTHTFAELQVSNEIWEEVATLLRAAGYHHAFIDDAIDMKGIALTKQKETEAIKRERDKLLICTVGLPRGGKTTWARSQSYPIVNPDSIRLAIHGQRFISEAEGFVWATARAMVRALFLAGHDSVILDACNNARARRDEWRSQDWDTVFKVIPTLPEVCIERARAECDDYIVPVIEGMTRKHEPLGEDEIVWP